MSDYTVGALVRVRDREWVVLPESRPAEDLLVLRPLGGTDHEITGIYLPLEPVESATFKHPDPATALGNHRSARLLRDAVRLGIRSGAGPFRSIARIAVEPRAYQLVPLLMALRQDPIRLLIADDVGIGKTIEALLIARELYDRAEIDRLAVLCPPHLAEQWQRTLRDFFHLDAALLLPSTVHRLERELTPGLSLFERHPITVISTDYIKSERHRDTFLNHAPPLVIVDEAHTCSSSAPGRAAQQRHRLLQDLARDPTRHILLVTATPHSGDADAFRSLIALLDPTLADLPQDLAGDHNRKHREHLARHLVQRRRGDITAWLDQPTPFPDRHTADHTYRLTADHQTLFEDVLAWCRERVFDPALEARRMRVRWWSALALLRTLSSSPAAAEAALRSRSATADAETIDDVDQTGRATLFDLDDTTDGHDTTPGARTEDDPDAPERRKLTALAARAAALKGRPDAKLQGIIRILRDLIDQGFAPIVFCRFIATVDYLVEHLTPALNRGAADPIEVDGITGSLPHDARERRIATLATHPRRVLICTDCLSEGIDLQRAFDAVIHYDLSWNPTRHEQREGRVDRYGQTTPEVRALTWYGEDNPFDGFMMDVLVRKQRQIRKTLGVTVPITIKPENIESAFLEWMRLRDGIHQLALALEPTAADALAVQWQADADRQKKNRSLFAQHTLKAHEVAPEIEAMRAALGDENTVRRFVLDALTDAGATTTPRRDRTEIHLTEAPPALRDALTLDRTTHHLAATFHPPAPPGVIHLTRTHPIVEGLARHITETALDQSRPRDPHRTHTAARCAAIRTTAVTTRTTALLLRLRFHLITPDHRPLLAEEQLTVAFTGAPDTAATDDTAWLDDPAITALLDAEPTGNLLPEQARTACARIIDALPALDARLAAIATTRGQALLAAHTRVRAVTHQRNQPTLRLPEVRVDPHLPADLLGVYIYLPAPAVALAPAPTGAPR